MGKRPVTGSIQPISDQLEVNVDMLQRVFTLTPDLVIRTFESSFAEGRVALVYLSGLVDKNSINNNLLQPLLASEGNAKTSIMDVLSVGAVTAVSDWASVEAEILQGSSVLFIEGRGEALIAETRGWPQRAVEDPQLEASLKGAHQGFVETDIQNIVLIRRYIPNRELKIKQVRLGERGKSVISILYMADIINPDVLKELEDRISMLQIDAILNTGELEELIEDNPFSPFPQFVITERPDSAASHLLQGRLAVVVDRSPSVLIGPVTFASFFSKCG